MLPNRGGELLQGDSIESLPRLIRIWLDQIDVDLLQAGSLGGRKERVESPPECPATARSCAQQIVLRLLHDRIILPGYSPLGRPLRRVAAIICGAGQHFLCELAIGSRATGGRIVLQE